MSEAKLIEENIPALSVKDLEVLYRVRGRDQRILRKISFQIRRGEAYGLVGESGCGKSTAAYSVIRYLPRNGRISGGSVQVDGQDMMSLSPKALCRLRASSVSMVYQDPGRALNPAIKIGNQIAEVFEINGMSRAEGWKRSLDMLERVRISAPSRVMEAYPHQLSGGMQQRVIIAMALAKNPSLLILDEPTTGLDATVEAEILDLVSTLRREYATAVLFISHSLAVVRAMCDRVGVLYAGELVEEGPAEALFKDPRHPYTAGLLRSLPRYGSSKDQGALTVIPGFLPTPGQVVQGCVFVDRCELRTNRCLDEFPEGEVKAGRLSRCHHADKVQELSFSKSDSLSVKPAQIATENSEPLVRVRDLTKTFGNGDHRMKALNGLTFDLRPGETLGLVGESGSGKTTLGKILLGLMSPDAGSTLELDGQALGMTSQRTREQIKSIQMVFQNPGSAINRSHSIKRIIGRSIHQLAGYRGNAMREKLYSLTEAVRLPERYLSMRPKQLSGGLKQRVGIARAFAGEPKLIVCDEPTSALDVSVQAAILNLLVNLQAERNVTYVFISHDLGVVRYISDRIAVLYLGHLIEIGPAAEVVSGPHHPYTEALLAAAPDIDGLKPGHTKLTGAAPNVMDPPAGCIFHTRCPRMLGPICEHTPPPTRDTGMGHQISCHIPIEELPRVN